VAGAAGDALPTVDVSALAAARDSGTDIGAQLEAIHLTPAAFGYLLHVAALVQVGAVTEAEWRETEDVWSRSRRRLGTPTGEPRRARSR
jgi:hypothetical protein